MGIQNFANSMRIVGNAIGQGARTAAQAAANVGRQTATLARVTWSTKIRPGMTVAWNAIRQAATWVGRNLARAFGWVWRVMQGVATAVRQWAGKAAVRVKSFARSTIKKGGQLAGQAATRVKGFAQSAAKQGRKMLGDIGEAYRAGYSRVRSGWKHVQTTSKDFVKKPVRTTVKVVAKTAGRAVRVVNAANKKVVSALTPRPNATKMTPRAYRRAARARNAKVNTMAATLTTMELLAGYGVMFGVNQGGKS